MGHDDFDEAPPPDEGAEDFANFDPETYLRRRNAGRYGESSDAEEETPPLETDEFAQFKPGDYLKQRYASRSYLSQSPHEQAATGRRRGRPNDPNADRVRAIDKQIGGERQGCFSRLFDLSEQFGLVREILTEGGPVVKIIGCVIVVALGAICVVGYLVVASLTNHP
jgi:hypothetical protein